MAYASKNLSLEEKAAQLLMIDLPDCQELSPRSAAHLGNYAWNGVVLFAKNVSDLAGTQNLVNQLQEAARYPLYMAIDQEGGLVDRFRFPQFSLSPGASPSFCNLPRESLSPTPRFMNRSALLASPSSLPAP